MKLVIKTDYDTYYLFPPGTDSTRVIEAFAGAMRLKAEGYGKARVFLPKDDGDTTELTVEFVPDDSIHFPSPDSAPYVERLLATEKDLNDTRAKLYHAELDLKKVTKELEAQKDRAKSLLGPTSEHATVVEI